MARRERTVSYLRTVYTLQVMCDYGVTGGRVKSQPIHQARALVVYYSSEMYGPRKSIVLCDTHRQGFYSVHPDTCGCGEWRPVSECEYCKLTQERK